MLMALGPFRFSLDLAALESLQDRETARIEQMQRAGIMPTPQFLCPGERTVMIDAVIYKQVLAPGRPLQVELMRVAIRQGLRLPLIARSGHFYGFFMIEELSIDKTHVLPNGTFQKMEVTLRLIRAPRGVSLFGVQLFWGGVMAGRSIPDAISYGAARRACGYKTEEALTNPPDCLGWSRGEWDSLSPGFKREIERDLRRRGLIPDLCSPPPEKKSFEDIKAEVEYAGRKRL